ncbi:M24 family metallopeptidase [Microbacterium sp. CCNWLW134]|uniref:M24 family metallopeptidase n=1 Tax=Microbacterium sp. CCNWLW134 TaxID=3122064 RepID=UPI00300F973A
MINDEAAIPFSRAEYAARLDRVRTRLQEKRVDVAVLTAPDTIAWLTGYRSRWYRHHTSTAFPPVHALVIDLRDDRLFLIDAEYHEDLARGSSVVTDFRRPDAVSATGEPSLDEFVAFLFAQIGQLEHQNIGVERWSCVPSPAVASIVDQGLVRAGAMVSDVSLTLRAARRLKSASEIQLIRQAQAACDAGIEAIVASATPDMTELEAWGVYSLGMARAGGEPAALHETVAAGSAVSDIHALSGRRRLGSAPVVYPDMAAAVHGYHARATRPLVFGPADDETARLAEIVAGVYDVIEAVGMPGTPWSVLADAVRRYSDHAGIDTSAGGYELGLSVPPADWVGEFTWAIEDPPAGIVEAGLVTNLEIFNSVIMVDTIVFLEDGPQFLSRLPRSVLEIR